LVPIKRAIQQGSWTTFRERKSRRPEVVYPVYQSLQAGKKRWEGETELVGQRLEKTRSR